MLFSRGSNPAALGDMGSIGSFLKTAVAVSLAPVSGGASLLLLPKKSSSSSTGVKPITSVSLGPPPPPPPPTASYPPPAPAYAAPPPSYMPVQGTPSVAYPSLPPLSNVFPGGIALPATGTPSWLLPAAAAGAGVVLLLLILHKKPTT